MASTFRIPPGQTVRVRIIDTTSRIGNVPTGALIEPYVPGFDYLPTVPSWSFLIEHASGKKILFDLGVPKDWKDMSPTVSLDPSWHVDVTRDTSEILQQHGVAVDEISSIIWSHWHWDHLGDPKTFPSTTEVVVGPGFKNAFMPGYPAKTDSPVRESDFKGRELREINFEATNEQTGQFRASDFFGDGSFYLLDTPGHAIGHLCGLARTTTGPDTFILMGGDLCHHSGELRPSHLVPLPQDDYLRNLLQKSLRHAPRCPGAVIENIQKSRKRTVVEPIFDPAMGHDVPETIRTIKKAQEADADENIWFVYAHDRSLLGLGVDLFPADANSWKQKGWGGGTRWSFLEDFVAVFDGAASQEN